jgi:hypothetical protein
VTTNHRLRIQATTAPNDNNTVSTVIQEDLSLLITSSTVAVLDHREWAVKSAVCGLYGALYGPRLASPLMSYLLVACRMLLLGVFVVALAGKARRRSAYREFVSSVAALGVVPHRMSGVVAAVVTTVEAAVVLLLAAPATVLAGFGLATVLLAVFTTGILLALRKGRRAPCHCFGASSTPLGVVHVVRNLVLIAVGVAGLLSGLVATGHAPHPAGLLLAVTAALLGLVPVLRMDDLMVLFSTPAGREDAK